jgi:hypothetical protein
MFIVGKSGFRCGATYQRDPAIQVCAKMKRGRENRARVIKNSDR